MELISKYLETYKGRDKFVKTFSYSAKFATIFFVNSPANHPTCVKLKTFSSQLSNCRTILRLFDDIPLIHAALIHCRRRDKQNTLLWWLEFAEIIVDIVSSPVETICWAGEQKLLAIHDIGKWDKISTWFWICSLQLSLLKQLMLIVIDVVSKKMTHHRHTLICIQTLLDLVYAVSHLPSSSSNKGGGGGILWAGKLSTWQLGALGSLSSYIGLYQSLIKSSKSSLDEDK